jgi:hypothetical protein
MSLSEVVSLLAALGTLATITGLVITIRRNTATSRLDTLQRMVAEMNHLRQQRATNPSLERSLFPDRRDWTDEQIAEHLAMVQLANTLEWAYIARRSGMLDLDVWESWVATWRGVIENDTKRDSLYHASVWTFGRTGTMAKDLERLTKGDDLPDPYSRKSSRRR